MSDAMALRAKSKPKPKARSKNEAEPDTVKSSVCKMPKDWV